MEEHKNLVRLYVPDADFSAGAACALAEGQAHYLRNVMRKSAGDALRVFNGRDGDWRATLAEISKNKAFIKLNYLISEYKPGPDIRVLASPVKKDAFDLMIEKSCELGAAAFVPVICARTVVHKVNQERAQAIAVEAAEQCERGDVMTIAPAVDLKKYLNSGECDRNIIFCIERREAPPLIEVAKPLAGKPLAILIGPEGGFSPEEIEFITKIKNIRAASLGPRILRAETALIAALSVAQLLS
ncbi:MAG: 16S rRNA (uracil(1498)-N(3))-methyltransferase [Alphaproteobacteria bacterium]|nr:16S rRNA (uracil(1498)-N(3))-methyltransferase [Alphaproteobacteria bacterium]MDE2336138.1 16S rRNA (uracil(1498)-N(3))-methyltransferase [Alphaproteobacteria bacterium]